MIQAEFGGPSTNILLQNYYRGGTYVPNTPTNANVPTSGAISLESFYGASVVSTNVAFSASSFTLTQNSGGAGTAAEIDFSFYTNQGGPVAKFAGTGSSVTATTIGTWYTGTLPAVNAYAIMATLVSGGPLTTFSGSGLTPSPVNSWINMNTSVAQSFLWGLYNNASGTRTATVQLQIRNNSTLAVVTTTTLNLTAIR